MRKALTVLFGLGILWVPAFVSGQGIVQNYDLRAITRTDGVIPVGNGTEFVGESGATLRTSIGLGTIATQAANSVAITGGTIDGTIIGGTTRANGYFSYATMTNDCNVGVNDTTRGTFRVYGNATTSGGRLAFYNSADNDGTIDLYEFRANGALEIGRGTTYSDLTIGTDGTVGLLADNQKLTLGAAGATDSYLQYTGTALDLYAVGGVTVGGGGIGMSELAADPADPAEGKSVLWQSDGTGAGDDGDIMIKVTAGSVTKTITLVDFSAF